MANRAPTLPEVPFGKIVRWPDFGSAESGPRNVDIWLPEDYDPAKRYATLYMHDGQMLFDAKITWNQQCWHVAETLTRLVRIGSVRETLVIGPWNRGDLRYADYFPQNALPFLPAEVRADLEANELKGNPGSNAYLRFLVEELKPEIDKAYATDPGCESTFVAGSSMGGLISMAALCEYPKVFGGAACLSTHWPGAKRLGAELCANAFASYLQANLPKRGGLKLYFDRGDQELDALYAYGQALADRTVAEAGWTDDQFTSLLFPGDDHSENAWSGRLFYPLQFLLGRPAG